MTIEELYQLLGVKAVLLPIRYGLKKYTKSGWPQLTYAKTQEAGYQEKLHTHGNTGVLLGAPSENLCTIDFDDDSALALFLSNNPTLANTLQTKGSRGANLWLVIEGEYPEKWFKILNDAGENIGEWRGGKGYTLIRGQHPEGMQYKIVRGNKPVRMPFDSLNWAGFPTMEGRCYIDDKDNTEATENRDITEEIRKEKDSPLSTNTSSFLDRVRMAEQAREALEKDKRLNMLYQQMIAKKFTPQQGERYSQLEAMVAFLHCAVGLSTVMPLAMAFYDVNQNLFLDTRGQHEAEAKSLLRGCRDSWLQALTAQEREHHDALATLAPRYTDAFRICRSLSIKKDAPEDRSFFLSCDQLGKRIGLECSQAGRVLQVLQGVPVIKLVEKGSQYTKKNRGGKASVYRWEG